MALFVWDYHGTLEKGNEMAVLELSNLALKSLCFRQKFTIDDIRNLYGRPWKEYFASMLPEEPEYVHGLLNDIAVKISGERPDIRKTHIQPTPHSHDVLTALATRHRQVLLSNCNDIVLFLRLTDMERHFPEGHRYATAATTPARSKQELLDDYLLRHPATDVVLIGDSPADIALKPRTRTFLYAHPGQEFRDCDADHKIRDLRDVLRAV